MYTQRFDLEWSSPPDGYNGVTAYARVKRAQVVLAHEWARRWGATAWTAIAMHPGWVDTPGLAAGLPSFTRLGPLLRSPDQGADTVVWLAADGPETGLTASSARTAEGGRHLARPPPSARVPPPDDVPQPERAERRRAALGMVPARTMPRGGGRGPDDAAAPSSGSAGTCACRTIRPGPRSQGGRPGHRALRPRSPPVRHRGAFRRTQLLAHLHALDGALRRLGRAASGTSREPGEVVPEWPPPCGPTASASTPTSLRTPAGATAVEEARSDPSAMVGQRGPPSRIRRDAPRANLAGLHPVPRR